jgi:uncharacterized protein YdbL (DUF1318 family)
MRLFFLLITALIFVLGCARVRVEAPKEPIKVDISMRLDIYQHVEKDINDIESIVSGSKSPASKSDKNSGRMLFSGIAYAQEGLSTEVESAALKRKGRLASLSSLEEKGIVGEGKDGLVVLRSPDKADSAAKMIISEENTDRMIIYKALAQKNSTSLAEVQKLYAKKLQGNAPAGTPIEVLEESTGKNVWKTK